MSGQVIQVIVKFLHIFSMITFPVMQAKQSFFKNRVLSVPDCNGETKILEDVRYAGYAVFTRLISPAMCMIKRKILPCVSILTVILSNCSPLTLTNIRSPLGQRIGIPG